MLSSSEMDGAITALFLLGANYAARSSLGPADGGWKGLSKVPLCSDLLLAMIGERRTKLVLWTACVWQAHVLYIVAAGPRRRTYGGQG